MKIAKTALSREVNPRGRGRPPHRKECDMHISMQQAWRLRQIHDVRAGLPRELEPIQAELPLADANCAT